MGTKSTKPARWVRFVIFDLMALNGT